MEYKKLYIQQIVRSGASYSAVSPVIDTQTSFRVVCQEFPFKYLPESKKPAKREWYDEDGEDVYIPSDGLRFNAYSTDVKFLYVGSESTMGNDIKSFVEFITGKNSGGSSMLAIYDEYTKTGRRGVYVENVDNDLFFYDNANSDVIAVFKVKFRVTDPVTNVVLTM